MVYERIDNSSQFDGPVRNAHEMRYHIAAGFVTYGDTVLDAGCGVGYGKRILTKGNIADNQIAQYIGLDKNPPFEVPGIWYSDFEDKDFMESQQYSFDVFVGFEIMEHLDPVGHFIKLAKQAKKWVIVSTPIVPNSNPYHKQQFTAEMVRAMFTDENWQQFGEVVQDNLYGIFVFKRVA